MRRQRKNPLVAHTIYLLIFIVVISTFSSLSLDFFYNVSAQDDGEEDDDGNNSEETTNNNDFEGSLNVIIPENAAWSQSIDERFDPSKITIPVGTKVTWINEDESQHTVTSGNLTNQGRDAIYDGKFYSGMLRLGDSFSYTFNESGTYSYFCSPHPWMTGVVFVEDGANAQEGEEENFANDQDDNDEDDDDDDDDDN